MRPALLLLLGSCALMAAELRLADGTAAPYDELMIAVRTPMAFAVIKTAEGTRSLRWSEVDIARLPEPHRTEVARQVEEQRQQRMFIVGDKWVHRNEIVLNSDPRYAAGGKLVKAGKAVITVDNQSDQVVTIGVRSGGRGFEMHIEPRKKKGYPVPDGRLHYLLAEESPDGTKLLVRQSQPIDLKPEAGLTVTVSRERVRVDDMVALEIPAQYQVR